MAALYADDRDGGSGYCCMVSWLPTSIMPCSHVHTQWNSLGLQFQNNPHQTPQTDSFSNGRTLHAALAPFRVLPTALSTAMVAHLSCTHAIHQLSACRIRLRFALAMFLVLAYPIGPL